MALCDDASKAMPLECAGVLLQNVVNIAAEFGVAVAIIFLVWGGIKFVTSGGDKGKIEEGRQTMVYAIIGLLVIIFSFAIIRLIAALMGFSTVPIFNLPGP